MALELKLSRKFSSYINFVYEDITGDYNVTTNPTGWGTPNSGRADVVSAILVISSDKLDNIITTDVTTEVTTGVTEFTINYNGTNIIPDGTYSATLTVTFIGSSVEVTLETGNWFNVQANIFKRIARIPEFFKCNDCCNAFIKETMCMYMLLQALIAAAQYNNMSEFTDILTTLTQMVDFDTTWELTS